MPNDFVPDFSSEDFTLESILAEYKGSAYIDGDKKTPTEVLSEKTEEIMREAYGKVAEPAPDKHEPVAQAAQVPVQALRQESAQTADTPPKPEVLDDKDVIFFETYKEPSADITPDIVDEISRAVEAEISEISPASMEKRTKRKQPEQSGALLGVNRKSDYEPLPDPDYREAARNFGFSLNSLSSRSLAAFVLSLILAAVTFIYEFELTQFKFLMSRPTVVGISLILLLLVMILGIDLLIYGFRSFIAVKAGVETLIFFSCVLSVTEGIISLLLSDSRLGLPLCAVSAFSLTFALFGEKAHLTALYTTLRTAASSGNPYTLCCEYREGIDKTLLKKTVGQNRGFYDNLLQSDFSESSYTLVAPLLLLFSLLAAALVTVKTGGAVYLPQTLATILTPCASFSAIYSFSMPFSKAAKKARVSGTAIAGWGGADDIFWSDGYCLTDDDVFPYGSVSISSSKKLDTASADKALRYTCSLIITSGSGLSRVFSETLARQEMSPVGVDGFSCHEDGIEGRIRGETVLVGSAAFVNLYGVRVPDELNIKNAIFTVVGGKLIALFTVDYQPSTSIGNALASVAGQGLTAFSAFRDFNITPLMLGQKYNLEFSKIEKLPIRDAYDISDVRAPGGGRVAALLLRDGLSALSECTGLGIGLRRATVISTLVSLGVSSVGFIIMTILSLGGPFVDIRCGMMLLYMMLPLIATFAITAISFRKT